MSAVRGLSLLAACLCLVACSSSGTNAFSLTANTAIKWNVALGAALAVYLVYDPLAPNWEIEEAKLAGDHFHLSMKMKRFHTGGSGEALQVLKRRAGQLQHELGYAGYEIASYSEGIDSQTLGARRVAEGTLRFVKLPDADSFTLN